MMQSFSPFTRRLIAIAILLLAGLAALNLAIAIGSATGGAVSDLEDARFRLARLVALQTRPLSPPGKPVAADLYFTAPDREAAAGMVATAITSAAAGQKLALENMAIAAPDGINPFLIRFSFAATGPEENILGLVNDVESKRPAIRLRVWRIAAIEGQPPALRLEATAFAAWSQAR